MRSSDGGRVSPSEASRTIAAPAARMLAPSPVSWARRQGGMGGSNSECGPSGFLPYEPAGNERTGPVEPRPVSAVCRCWSVAPRETFPQRQVGWATHYPVEEYLLCLGRRQQVSPSPPLPSPDDSAGLLFRTRAGISLVGRLLWIVLCSEKDPVGFIRPWFPTACRETSCCSNTSAHRVDGRFARDVPAEIYRLHQS